MTNTQPSLNWQSISTYVTDTRLLYRSICQLTLSLHRSTCTHHKTLDLSALGNWAIYWSIIVRWLRKDALLKALLLGSKQKATILVKTFGTLCVLGEENVIQVDPLPPPPPEQCWVLQVKHLLHILYTLWTSTLFRGGGGKILLRPCLWVCIAG